MLIAVPCRLHGACKEGRLLCQQRALGGVEAERKEGGLQNGRTAGTRRDQWDACSTGQASSTNIS